MSKFSLSSNESIIIQKRRVYYGSGSAEIALTSENIVCIIEDNKLFKSNSIVKKYSLERISMMNGKPQVTVEKSGSYWVLSIVFDSGVESFSFNSELLTHFKVKMEVEKWANEIGVLLTGNEIVSDEGMPLVNNVKDILGSIGIELPSKSNEPENKTVNCIGCRAPLSGKKGQFIVCSYCDTNQTL